VILPELEGPEAIVIETVSEEGELDCTGEAVGFAEAEGVEEGEEVAVGVEVGVTVGEGEAAGGEGSGEDN
jgi:hypothetical protein